MRGAHIFPCRYLYTARELYRGTGFAAHAALDRPFGGIEIGGGQGWEVVGLEVVAKPIAAGEHAATLDRADARVVRKMRRYCIAIVSMRRHSPTWHVIA